MPNATPTTAPPKRRWFHITPDRIVVLLLAVDGVLFFSERFRCFGFNENKGWTVLIAVTSVGLALLVLLVGLAGSMVLRGRFQFSLRSLLVLVMAAALPCCWLGVEIRAAGRQKEAVNAIHKARGVVEYDLQDWHGIDLGRRSPDWLRNLVGRDFLEKATGVNFFDPSINNYAWDNLEALRDLNWLAVEGTTEPYRNRIRTQFTDSDLEHLGKLPHIKYLFLPGSQITNEGLQSLEGLTQLRSLDLWNTNITDEGIAHLKGWKQLRSLDVGKTHITETGLHTLETMQELEDLDIQQINVADEAVRTLERALPNCRIVR